MSHPFVIPRGIGPWPVPAAPPRVYSVGQLKKWSSVDNTLPGTSQFQSQLTSQFGALTLDDADVRNITKIHVYDFDNTSKLLTHA